MVRITQAQRKEKEQAAAEQETALRGKALTSMPTGGSSRQQALAAKKASDLEKKKGKMPASSTRDESDDDSEDEPAPPKKAKKSTDHGKMPYADRDREKKPTPAVFLDFLKRGVTWSPTRFGDTELMEEIGIDDDIKAMLGNMHMSDFYSLAYPTYKDLASEFLASLRVTYHQSVHVRQGWGKITFTVEGKTYNITFKNIGNALGLKDAGNFRLPKLRGLAKEDNIPAKVWNLITGTRHSSGGDKSSAIRNPAIRYLHRMLVHAFFPRKEPGNVNEEDLKLLCLALKRFAPKDIPFDVDELYKDFGMVGFFMTRLEYYRDWAWSSSDSELTIGIGGMITPLLQLAYIDLKRDAAGPTFLDATHMKVAQYFSGRYFGSCVYLYKNQGNPVELILPNKSITCLEIPGAVSFAIGEEHFLGPHGKLGPMALSKRKQSMSAAQYARLHKDEIAEDTTEVVYGPRRYHFQPYAGALAPGPLRDAHEHIGKLERWNKHQDRTIFKLKTKCKELSKAMKRQAQASARFMKKVTEVLTRGAIAGCSAADFDLGDTSAPQPHPGPLALSLPFTARQIRRRNRNPDILPSSSGNKSPSLNSTDGGEDSEEEATASTHTP